MKKPAIWITFVSCANELYGKEESGRKRSSLFRSSQRYEVSFFGFFLSTYYDFHPH